MRLLATCGHTFDLPGVNSPESIKCAACDKIVGIWAVDYKEPPDAKQPSAAPSETLICDHCGELKAGHPIPWPHSRWHSSGQVYACALRYDPPDPQLPFDLRALTPDDKKYIQLYTTFRRVDETGE